MSRSQLATQFSQSSTFFKDFFDPEQSSQPQKISGHSTQVLRDKAGKRWLFKQFDSEILAITEVAVAHLYRAILPSQIPRMLLITDENKNQIVEEFDQDDDSSIISFEHKVQGTASQFFEVFLDLSLFLSNALSPEQMQSFCRCGIPDSFLELITSSSLAKKIDWLADHGLIEVLAASALFQEDDAHKGNIGISFNEKNGEFCVVRIDFDMSFFPFLAKKGRKRNNPADRRNPLTSLKLSHEDIKNFPHIVHANPYYWPTIYQQVASSHGYTIAEIAAFQMLAHREDCKPRTFSIFLPFLLIPPTLISQAFLNPEAVDAFLIHQTNLRYTLLNNPTFINWLRSLELSNINHILSEFGTYNQILSTDEMRLSIESGHVKENFNVFLRDANLPALAQVLQFVKTRIEGLRTDKSTLQEEKQELVNCIVTFTRLTTITDEQLTRFVQQLESSKSKISSEREGRGAFDTLNYLIGQLTRTPIRENTLIILTPTQTVLTSEQVCILLNQTDVWLSTLSNGHTLTCLFDEAYEEYREQFSSLSLFFCSKPVSKEAFAAPYKQLKEAKSINETRIALGNLLSSEGTNQTSTASIHFAKKILGHCIKLFQAQLFAAVLAKQPNDPPIVWDENTIKLITPNICDALINQLAETRSLEPAEDDWMSVSY